MLDVVVQSLSHVQLFMTPWTAAIQAPPSFTISQSLFKFMPFELMMLSDNLIPCLLPPLCLQSFPASGSFPMSQRFASGGQIIGASASTSILPMNIQGWFPLGLTGLAKCCSRDSQKSTASQFKGISFSVLSLLYGSPLTSIHDYWKNHSFDDTELYWQSGISTFQCAVWVCHSSPSKKQVSFTFMAAVTIHSDFGAFQKSLSALLLFPFYLLWIILVPASVFYDIKWGDSLKILCRSDCWSNSRLINLGYCW